MKKYYSLWAVLFALATLTSCDKDNENEVMPEPVVEVKTVADLQADAADTYTYYSLEDNKQVAAADAKTANWDIAFKGTSILVNGGTSGPGKGGAQVVDGIFAEKKEAPETGYVTDAEGKPAIAASSDASWYHYTAMDAPQHAILPIAGKVIMLKTAKGNYAKLEIQSYYKGNPDTTTPAFASMATRPASKHYTFRYALQPSGSNKF
ncbi:HmuY family protein [Pontibacter rugosus]|uniref:HmuY family protein n=1 Tax=Pontibacter rugosus TaxID=1745966 RepID=A0ABW3SRT3_9BACT